MVVALAAAVAVSVSLPIILVVVVVIVRHGFNLKTADRVVSFVLLSVSQSIQVAVVT